jgi:hypothetical protein
MNERKASEMRNDECHNCEIDCSDLPTHDECTVCQYCYEGLKNE